MSFLRRLFFSLSYYRPHPPWELGISPPELLDFIRSHPPGRALDLGCGTGTNVITLAKAGWQVTGIDFARRAIAMARKKAKQTQVTASFRYEDLTRPVQLEGPFDLILDVGCFHALNSLGRQGYSRNVERWLAPGSYLLMYAFFRRPRDKPESRLPGLVDRHLEVFDSFLKLEKREDGINPVWGGMPCAWLTYRRPLSSYPE